MSRKRTRSKSEDIMAASLNSTGLTMAAPYSQDYGPRKFRNQCNNFKITFEMASNGNALRPVRVFTDGAFDLFHQGHANLLRQAKSILPNVYLIVGVHSDKTLGESSGKTVLTEEERYNAVRHCRYVDEVIIGTPWNITAGFLSKHKIDFVAHEDVPYFEHETSEFYTTLKRKGMFLPLEKIDDVSTSELVSRIVKDYDVYVRRNLARGYTAKELNVSFLTEKKYLLQNKVIKLKDKLLDDISIWEDKSKEIIDSWLGTFSKKGLKGLWDQSKSKLFHSRTLPDSSSSSFSLDSTNDDEDEVDSFSASLEKYRRVC